LCISTRQSNNQQKGGTCDKLICAHYDKIGHENTRCFEIIEHPEGWGRGGRGGRGNYGEGRGKGRGHASANAISANIGATLTYSGDHSQFQILR
jgi:hypothetical protein